MRLGSDERRLKLRTPTQMRTQIRVAKALAAADDALWTMTTRSRTLQGINLEKSPSLVAKTRNKLPKTKGQIELQPKQYLFPMTKTKECLGAHNEPASQAAANEPSCQTTRSRRSA